MSELLESAPPRLAPLATADASGADTDQRWWSVRARPKEAAEQIDNPLSVVVIASDPLTTEGTVAYLRSAPGITPISPDCLDRADVVLVMATAVTEETLAAMRRIGQRAAGGQARFVLVGDGVQARQLARAANSRLVSVIPRQDADLERIVQVVRAVAQGRVELPLAVLNSRASPESELEAREIDVLRLLADGLGTAEIARRLAYSERTVKNIIHGVLSRLGLRNRSHAVAFALRNGLL